MAGKDQKKKDLLYDIRAIDAYGEIQNLMQRAAVAFMFHQGDILKGFFSKEEHVSICFPNMEKQQGFENVSAFIDQSFGASMKPGEMVDCHLCSPSIVVSENMTTAYGHWKVISAIGKPVSGAAEAAKAMWGMGTLSAAFAHKDSKWNITSIYYERNVLCDYDLGWAKESQR